MVNHLDAIAKLMMIHDLLVLSTITLSIPQSRLLLIRPNAIYLSFSSLAGNEIVDSEYLRNNEGKVQILSNNDMIQQQQQKTPTSTDVHPTITLNTDGDIYMSPDNSDSRNSDEEKKYIIDISPKPIHKLRQNTNSHARFNPSTISRKSGHSSAAPTTLGAVEGSISSTPLIQSTLVVRDLDIDKHTSRYACRAQNRVSSDEVSTMIRIQGE